MSPSAVFVIPAASRDPGDAAVAQNENTVAKLHDHVEIFTDEDDAVAVFFTLV